MKDKDLEKLMRLARKQGWTITRNKRGGHLKWWPPNPEKQMIISSVTKGDYRGAKNLIARLKKEGLVI